MKPATDAEQQVAATLRVKRVLNAAFGWIALNLYTVAAFYVMVTWHSWPETALPIGIVVIAAYCFVVLFVWGGISLFRSRDSIEPTEWMRRGGLMASPETSARPDEARIRMAVSLSPEDVRNQVREGIEAYLAMHDAEEKQLYRDRLIRAFYARAGSSKGDYAHRKAFNDLRLALSPWAEGESGD